MRAYPTASTDNRTPFADGFLPTLTVRGARERRRASRSRTPNGASAPATDGGRHERTNQICYPAGFKPGHLYELIYRAKDPLVLGLGFAAARDLGAFLKNRETDDAGHRQPGLPSPATRRS